MEWFEMRIFLPNSKSVRSSHMLKTTFEKVTMHLIRLSNLYLIYAKSAFFSFARLKHVIMSIFFYFIFFILSLRSFLACL